VVTYAVLFQQEGDMLRVELKSAQSSVHCVYKRPLFQYSDSPGDFAFVWQCLINLVLIQSR
jgi:hypothetical protein